MNTRKNITDICIQRVEMPSLKLVIDKGTFAVKDYIISPAVTEISSYRQTKRYYVTFI